MKIFFDFIFILVVTVLTGFYWFEYYFITRWFKTTLLFNQFYRKLMVAAFIVLLISWLIVTFY